MPPVKVPKDTKAVGCEKTHCLPRFVRRSIAETCARTGPRKKGAGMFLPVHWVPARPIVVTSGVFSNTLMSPLEHSRKHRQRTGPRKKGAGNLLPVIPVHDTMNCDSALQLAKTAMSPVEDSWKHR
jgi:hypothetical protein